MSWNKELEKNLTYLMQEKKPDFFFSFIILKYKLLEVGRRTLSALELIFC